jgi:hypothetical protein
MSNVVLLILLVAVLLPLVTYACFKAAAIGLYGGYIDAVKYYGIVREDVPNEEADDGGKA